MVLNHADIGFIFPGFEIFSSDTLAAPSILEPKGVWPVVLKELLTKNNCMKTITSDMSFQKQGSSNFG